MIDTTRAFIDESLRTNEGISTYYLCAVIDRGIESAQLRSLLPRGAQKLHWRDMGINLQRNSLALIGSLPIDAIVISASPVNMKKQERARRKCLELLLPLLVSAGVDVAVMESRSDNQNKQDREMAVSLLRKGWMNNITVLHAMGGDEPRLWIPDQILGAMGHVDAKGKASMKWKEEWKRVAKKVERREIAL